MVNILNKKYLNGIYLKRSKHTANNDTQVMPVPDKVIISMSQHMGSPCIPLVSVGEAVCVGQKIGETTQKSGPPIHASVSGVVTDLREIKTLAVFPVQSIVIRTDKTQTVCPELTKPVIKTKADFIRAVYESGLVGLGGAGFPTHRKLNIEKGSAGELLINAAECEPYITSDNREILEHPRDVIEGIKLVCTHLEIGQAVIGVEENKPDAIAILRNLCKNENRISVRALPSLYPQGAEKALIYSLTKKIVPENALPLDVGVIVMNVTSIAALYRYTQTGMPLLSRRVSVAGNLIKNPGNIRVPIGTKVDDLIAFWCARLTLCLWRWKEICRS